MTRGLCCMLRVCGICRLLVLVSVLFGKGGGGLNLQAVSPMQLLSIAGLRPSKKPRWNEHVSRI
jgi:hypothetical protein